MNGDVYFKGPNGAAYYTIEGENVDVWTKVKDDEVKFTFRFDRRKKEGEVTFDKDEFFEKFERYFER